MRDEIETLQYEIATLMQENAELKKTIKKSAYIVESGGIVNIGPYCQIGFLEVRSGGIVQSLPSDILFTAPVLVEKS